MDLSWSHKPRSLQFTLLLLLALFEELDWDKTCHFRFCELPNKFSRNQRQALAADQAQDMATRWGWEGGGLRSEALPKKVIVRFHAEIKRQRPAQIAQAGPPVLAVLFPGSPNPLPWSPYQTEALGIKRQDPPSVS